MISRIKESTGRNSHILDLKRKIVKTGIVAGHVQFNSFRERRYGETAHHQISLHAELRSGMPAHRRVVTFKGLALLQRLLIEYGVRYPVRWTASMNVEIAKPEVNNPINEIDCAPHVLHLMLSAGAVRPDWYARLEVVNLRNWLPTTNAAAQIPSCQPQTFKREPACCS